MRQGKIVAPTRYNRVKTSGSNKFVSTFTKDDFSESNSIVEKRDRTYNWVNYKWSLVFTVLIGILTYFLINYLMF